MKEQIIEEKKLNSKIFFDSKRLNVTWNNLITKMLTFYFLLVSYIHYLILKHNSHYYKHNNNLEKIYIPTTDKGYWKCNAVTSST